MSRLKTLVATSTVCRRCAAGTRSARAAASRWSSGPCSSTIDRPDRRRERDRLPRGRDHALPDDRLERAVDPRCVRERGRRRERHRERAARARRRHGLPAGEDSRLSCSPATGDLRHRPPGALGRAGARPPLPLRLLRQRGVHEHGRPALRRDAVRRVHDDEPGRPRELREGAAAQGHDGDRGRPPRAVRRAGRVDPLARPEPSRSSARSPPTARRS